MIFLWLVVGVVLSHMEKIFLKELIPKSVYSGFGATTAVILKKAKAPMQNRVLMAWLIYLTDKTLYVFRKKRMQWETTEHLDVYCAWKAVMTTLPLLLSYHLFGGGPTAILALAWVCVWQFDYWDIYVEALCFLLALTASLPLTILAAVLGALSRESTLLVVPIYLLATSDLWGTIAVTAAFGATLLLKRKWIGYKPEYYTARLAIHANFLWRWWLSALKDRRWYFAFGVLTIIGVSVTLVTGFSMLPIILQQTAVAAPGLLLFGGLIVGFIWEPRTFINSVIWIAPILAEKL